MGTSSAGQGTKADLILDAGLIQIVPADGACVCADGPGPHGHCIPLLDLKPLSRCWLSHSLASGWPCRLNLHLLDITLDIFQHSGWESYMGMCLCLCLTAGALQTLGWVSNAYYYTDIRYADCQFEMRHGWYRGLGQASLGRATSIEGAILMWIMQHQRFEGQSPSCSSDVGSPNGFSTCVSHPKM